MVNIIKASGETEEFNLDKLLVSLKKAKVPNSLEKKAIDHIQPKLYEGITSSEIYKFVTEFLDQEPGYYKSRYRLKQSIMELGPTGYPFEDLVSEVLKSKGYVTELRSTLMGKCVSHEIDVIAEKKDSEKLMVEAKFHNRVGTRTEIHVSLYTKARFDDLKEKYNFDRAWLFTNTKITTDALTYAICSNMGIMSWNYPQNEALRDIIEKNSLYPITILSSLSYIEKQKLLDNHMILAKNICANHNLLDILNLPKERKSEILKEVELICES